MKADLVKSKLKSIETYLNTALLLLLCTAGIAVAQQNTEDKYIASPGQFYLAETYKDWQKLCLAKEQGKHPCHMYQLIKDENGHPTAEFVIVKLNEEEGVSAAATILTPLETLLPSGLSYSIDDEAPVEYPFSWCDKRGCYVRIAFTDDDVYSMKKGNKGLFLIESISAPGKKIELTVSFSGFTAALGSLDE